MKNKKRYIRYMKYVNYLFLFLYIKSISCELYYIDKNLTNNDIIHVEYFKNYNNSQFNIYLNSVLKNYNYKLQNETEYDDLIYAIQWVSDDSSNQTYLKAFFEDAKESIIKYSNYINPETNTIPFKIIYGNQDNFINTWVNIKYY